ncbi:hypothetical protein MRB53_001950 [Persea americana]|uniref:Uncharacterized protein n=1 Tax=Persea americana TaxID=3435 RepID=A0ACC2MT21_PERAE|nr:hypothetical protein MRB53_001950 [Persea americana]
MSPPHTSHNGKDVAAWRGGCALHPSSEAQVPPRKPVWLDRRDYYKRRPTHGQTMLDGLAALRSRIVPGPCSRAAQRSRAWGCWQDPCTEEHRGPHRGQDRPRRPVQIFPSWKPAPRALENTAAGPPPRK